MAEMSNFDLEFSFFNDIFEEVDPSIFDEPFFEVNTHQNGCETKEELPVSTETKRFKSLSDEDLEKMSSSRYSDASKKNAKWAFRTFSDWCQEKQLTVDLKTISCEDLADYLARFYAEIAPKPCKQRQNGEYHKNSMKNIRAALNRYIQNDCGRTINIVLDPVFKRANDMLNGKLKFNSRHGLSAPTKHKKVIPPNHIQAMNKYLMQDNPISLRYRVWMHLGIHFVSRGLEFHSQLTPKSFIFMTDETGLEYATIVHTTQQKNHQGDLMSVEENPDKRMYATGDSLCPVLSLRKLIDRTDPKASSLFNHLVKETLVYPSSHKIWYSTKPVGKRQFSNFMPDICRNAGIDVRYTAHCLRATALSAMTDANVPGRHIISLSDHASESSLVPYTKPSSLHKQQMSRTLSGIFSASSATFELCKG